MDKKRYVKPEMQAVKVKLVHNVCSGEQKMRIFEDEYEENIGYFNGRFE